MDIKVMSKTEYASIRMPPALKKEIKKFAKLDDRNMSNFILCCVKKEIERLKNDRRQQEVLTGDEEIRP